MSDHEYAEPVIADLKAFADGLDDAGWSDHGAVDRAIAFLETRLTDAAIHGCHHCDEGDRAGAPCWWCGLRTGE